MQSTPVETLVDMVSDRGSTPLASTIKGHNFVYVDFILIDNYPVHISPDDARLLFRAFIFCICIFLKIAMNHLSSWRMGLGLKLFVRLAFLVFNSSIYAFMEGWYIMAAIAFTILIILQ